MRFGFENSEKNTKEKNLHKIKQLKRKKNNTYFETKNGISK